MNKNILLWLVVGVLAVGGIVYWLTRDTAPDLTFQDTTTTVPAVETSDTTVPDSYTPTSRKTGLAVITSNTRVVSVSNSAVLLTGSIVPNGALTTYWYEYGQTTALDGQSQVQVIGSGFNSISAPVYIGGLKANTAYSARVVAKNYYGLARGNTLSFTTNTDPPPVGKAPTVDTRTASNITRSTATLNGEVDPNSLATNYWFEYGQTTDFGNATNLQSVGSGNSAQNVSVALSNLVAVTKYYFRLNAQNNFGTVNGTIFSFTTQGPPAPGLPTVQTTGASKISTSSVVFNGKVNPNGGTTSYWFEYGTDSNLNNQVVSSRQQQVSSTGSANVDVSLSGTGLQTETKYYYRVVASNSSGTVRGNIVSFKTKH